MRKRGLEPPLPCGNKLLRLARLPIPPLPHSKRLAGTESIPALGWSGQPPGRASTTSLNILTPAVQSARAGAGVPNAPSPPATHPGAGRPTLRRVRVRAAAADPRGWSCRGRCSPPDPSRSGRGSGAVRGHYPQSPIPNPYFTSSVSRSGSFGNGACGSD